MNELLAKNVADNSRKIDTIAKYINKSNTKNCFQMLLVALTLYCVTKAIEKHEEEIDNLKKEIEEMKSKGV